MACAVGRTLGAGLNIAFYHFHFLDSSRCVLQWWFLINDQAKHVYSFTSIKIWIVCRYLVPFRQGDYLVCHLELCRNMSRNLQETLMSLLHIVSLPFAFLKPLLSFIFFPYSLNLLLCCKPWDRFFSSVFFCFFCFLFKPSLKVSFFSSTERPIFLIGFRNKAVVIDRVI